MSDAAWLTMERVSFGYGRQKVLRALDAKITENYPILSVVGPNGVGKSTLIKLLAGHLHPTEGRLELCGSARGHAVKRPVVFQDHALFMWLTVIENVAFGLKCQGVSKVERIRRAKELLHQIGLTGKENVYPCVLSGGMRQRVGLARALAVDPDCLLMDEPFSSLDPYARSALRQDLLRIILERRIKAVIVTHDLNEALELGNKALVMNAHFRTQVVTVSEGYGRSPAFRQTEAYIKAARRLRNLMGLMNSGTSNL